MFRINAENLSKAYSDKPAVSDVSFEAVSGQITGLLGANGAGKSTLIKMLAGVITPDQGDATLNGCSITANRHLAQNQIGYLPEAASGFDNLTVHEFLVFSANAHGLYGSAMHEAIENCLGMLQLGDARGELLSSLSKGWRQRAWLAQCFVHDPPIMFLDEPTDGLDPLQKIAIRSLIKSTGQSKIIIMSTHILEEAETLCDRLMIMHQGRLVETGATSDFTDKNGRLEASVTSLTRQR
ncbi:MAG TPA: multidrug ABC transporter ATP-binding protein [Alphaproteobacteria bacterium]|jgi:ABC-2 type transport system ATP-binding protein|nr:multidrug ABC transporter ATP-binding protein [Alphaproteobacteria bacterium]